MDGLPAPPSKAFVLPRALCGGPLPPMLPTGWPPSVCSPALVLSLLKLSFCLKRRFGCPLCTKKKKFKNYLFLKKFGS